MVVLGSAVVLLLCASPPAKPLPTPGLLAVVKHRAKQASAPYCAAFLPDSETVVFGGGGALGPGELLFWDVATRKVSKVCHDHKWAIKCLAISPDGKQIATGGGFGQVKVYDAEGKVLHNLSGHSNYTDDIAFSPDGKWLAHAGDDGKLTVRDTTKFEVLKEFEKRPVFGTSVDFAPDGKTLLGAGGGFFIHSVPNWAAESTKSPGKTDHYNYARYAPDGRSLVVFRSFQHPDDLSKSDYSTEVWSAVKGVPDKRLWKVEGHYLGKAFTPDGKLLLLGEMENEKDGADYHIRVFDATTGKKVTSCPIPDSSCIRWLTISPDGKLLVSCDDLSSKVWDLEKMLGKHWSAPPKGK